MDGQTIVVSTPASPEESPQSDAPTLAGLALLVGQLLATVATLQQTVEAQGQQIAAAQSEATGAMQAAMSLRAEVEEAVEAAEAAEQTAEVAALIAAEAATDADAATEPATEATAIEVPPEVLAAQSETETPTKRRSILKLLTA